MRVFQVTYRDRDGAQRLAARWYIEITDAHGRPRRLAGFVDRRATEELGRRIARLTPLAISGEQPDAATARWLAGLPTGWKRRLARIGLLSGQAAAAGVPLRQHLDDYEQSLRDSGATTEYVAKTIARVRRILDGIGATHASGLTGAAVSRFLADLRAGKAPVRAGRPAPKPLSAKSSNHYLAALKGFTAWLMLERRLSTDPLAHLTGLNANAQRVHVRRALEPEELRRVLEAARSGPVRCGMDGESRYWLIRLAVETGLRSNELRSLRRGSFDLNPTAPSVTVEAGATKNRRAATIPLRPATAVDLAGFLGCKAPTAPVFRMPRPELVVQMFRADLEAAGIPYRDDAGRVADFHSLRKSFASMLLRSGVDVRTARDLMRHATINMTADVYAVAFRGSLDEAVGRLPDLSAPAASAQRATGTDDAFVLAASLTDLGAGRVNVVPVGSQASAPSFDAQPLLATGTYGDCRRLEMNGGESVNSAPKLPPRGFEPLLPA
ncbi:MAG: tyrosine-type recombinase/integrase [Planctomycetes bacterium]|nr:tyrosine-type recombinase/integrase [Planctomycetota bacterium]